MVTSALVGGHVITPLEINILQIEDLRGRRKGMIRDCFRRVKIEWMISNRVLKAEAVVRAIPYYRSRRISYRRISYWGNRETLNVVANFSA